MDTKTLEQAVKDNLIAVDTEKLFDESLDESGTVTVAGLEFYPSKILSECDPTAYRCGLTDFEDYLLRDREYTDVDGNLYLTDEVEALREELENEEVK